MIHAFSRVQTPTATRASPALLSAWPSPFRCFLLDVRGSQLSSSEVRPTEARSRSIDMVPPGKSHSRLDKTTTLKLKVTNPYQSPSDVPKLLATNPAKILSSPSSLENPNANGPGPKLFRWSNQPKDLHYELNAKLKSSRPDNRVNTKPRSKNRGYLVYVDKTHQRQQKNQRNAPKKKQRLRHVLTEPKKRLTESNPQEDSKPKLIVRYATGALISPSPTPPTHPMSTHSSAVREFRKRKSNENTRRPAATMATRPLLYRAAGLPYASALLK